MKHHSTLITMLALTVLVLPAVTFASADSHRVVRSLESVDDSGVTGTVTLVQLGNGGTHINVVAQGLEGGTDYVSLYYENHTCALEPYSEDDVIGGSYTGNDKGLGRTHGSVDDGLDEINSVSVRLASDFTLLACADVNP